MDKRIKRLIVFTIPHVLIMGLCLLMILTGLATPFISTFALDMQGNLYVGEGKMLRIYHNGVLLREIEMEDYDYAFTINSNNELVVSYTSTVCRMDTSGKILDEWEDHNAKTYQELRRTGTNLTMPNGDKYRKVSELGWTRILRNGTEEIYRLSVFSFIIKLLMSLCFVSLFVNIPWLIYRDYKENKVQR